MKKSVTPLKAFTDEATKLMICVAYASYPKSSTNLHDKHGTIMKPVYYKGQWLFNCRWMTNDQLIAGQIASKPTWWVSDIYGVNIKTLGI